MNSEYQAALDFLFGRINYESTSNMPYNRARLKLSRMARLLELCGHPQRQQKIIHIAGTKGKGSTSLWLGSILTQAGYRTGRFTSPHLFRIEERFAVDGQLCSSQELTAYIQQLRPIVSEMDQQAARCGTAGPTYFELTTAIALLHFAARKTDYSILEVGLGGRLDSTNVCDPQVTAITSISYDHTRQLGPTLTSIAREKAGIIKAGVPVVNGVTDPVAQRVIFEVAERLECSVDTLGRDFDFSYDPPRCWVTATSQLKYFRIHRQTDVDPHDARQLVLSSRLNALGRHQAANASIAIAIAEQLRSQGAVITESSIRSALGESRCPGRIEIVATEPIVVLDVAHNVASIGALCGVLQESSAPRPRCVIFATSRDKDIDGMLSELLPHFELAICTRYLNNPRGVPASELAHRARKIADHAPQGVEIQECSTPAAAWQMARRRSPREGLICITGSFFIAAEIGTLMRVDHARPETIASVTAPTPRPVASDDALRTEDAGGSPDSAL